jgi:hypothetical protein
VRKLPSSSTPDGYTEHFGFDRRTGLVVAGAAAFTVLFAWLPPDGLGIWVLKVLGLLLFGVGGIWFLYMVARGGLAFRADREGVTLGNPRIRQPGMHNRPLRVPWPDVAEVVLFHQYAGRAGALERLAVMRWSQGDTRQSRAVLAEAAELLKHQPPSPELASVYAQTAASRTMAGQAQEALVLADEAVALADRFGLTQARLRALDARGVARCESGDLGGLDDLRAALHAGLESGAGYETAIVYNLLIEPLWLTEGPQAALETVDAALEFIERRGLAMEVWFKSSLLTLLFDLGRWDEVVETAAWIVNWERGHGGRYVTVSADSYTAQVLCWRGRVAAARELVDRPAPCRCSPWPAAGRPRPNDRRSRGPGVAARAHGSMVTGRPAAVCSRAVMVDQPGVGAAAAGE